MKLDKADLKRFQKKLDKARDTAPLKRAVRQVGEDLLARSLAVTPKRESDLRNSGNVQPIGTDAAPGVSVGYDAEYALAVHSFGMISLSFLAAEPR
ncbi:MAG: hypothetical protein ACRDSJ_16870 [Rubrobacteraceae bacterium]